METKKEQTAASTPVDKIVEQKRAKADARAQAKAQMPKPPQPRKLTEAESRFVDAWCVHMRPIDQALHIFHLGQMVGQLLQAEQKRQSPGGLIRPDGSNLN